MVDFTRVSVYVSKVVIALAALACGSTEKSAASAANGGAGGSSAGASSGGSSSSGGAGASAGGASGGAAPAGGQGGSATGGGGTAPTGGTGAGGAPLPECEPVPPRCPANVVDGDVLVVSGDEAAAQSGVTEITGDLEISTTTNLEAFDCLEIVGGSFEFSPLSYDGNLAVFRNLRSVGGQLDVTPGSFADVDISCALSSIESIGAGQVAAPGRLTVTGGVSGVLDVSTLTSIEHFLFRDTALERIVLPSNRALQMGQFEVERNDELLEISGFEQIDLTMMSGVLQLRVVDNPLLSTCWANALGARFMAAYEFAGVTISGNAADCQ